MRASRANLSTLWTRVILIFDQHPLNAHVHGQQVIGPNGVWNRCTTNRTGSLNLPPIGGRYSYNVISHPLTPTHPAAASCTGDGAEHGDGMTHAVVQTCDIVTVWVTHNEAVNVIIMVTWNRAPPSGDSKYLVLLSTTTSAVPTNGPNPVKLLKRLNSGYENSNIIAVSAKFFTP